jgi:hypothetical protein
METILRFGTPEQQARWLVPLLAEEKAILYGLPRPPDAHIQRPTKMAGLGVKASSAEGCSSIHLLLPMVRRICSLRQFEPTLLPTVIACAAKKE